MCRVFSIALLMSAILSMPTAQAAPVQGPNGNFYERFDEVHLWAEARVAATQLSFQGRTGHLATILDADTQAFILQNLRAGAPSSCWFGGTDEVVEGEWRWVTGELFWIGTAGGSVQNNLFENWGGSEPNNSGDEDGTEMGSGGDWNDEKNDRTNSCYFVEYSGSLRAIPISPVAMILTVLLLGALGIRRLAKHA